MHLILLLAGCFPPTDTTSDSGGSDSSTESACTEAPTVSVLNWDEPGFVTAAAADEFGFGIGAFVGSLHWEDGTTSGYTIVTTPISAEERMFGDPAVCSVLLAVTAGWEVVTDDRRVALNGEVAWESEQGAARGNLSMVVIDSYLEHADVGLVPEDPSATLLMRVTLRDTGDQTLVFRESWDLDAETRRFCIRASYDPSSLACWDEPIEDMNE